MRHLQSMPNRRQILTGAGATALACVGAPAIVRVAPRMKIGLLTPLTGALAFVGYTNQNCLTLAVEEINAAGGILGREVEIVAEDTQASSKVTVDKSRRLLISGDVAMLTGMVLPLEREAALKVAGGRNRLVIYPTFDEGRCHPNLLATGLSANQRIAPMAEWLVRAAGKKVFVLISDSGTARNVIVPQIKSNIERAGGTCAGALYFPFGTRDFGPALQQVKAADVDVVWHGIGDDRIGFVKQYQSFGMSPRLVTEITNESIAKVTDGGSVGTLAVAAYFMSVDTPQNARFLAAYNRQFANFTGIRVAGQVPVLPHGECTYVGAKIFAEAARIAGSVDADKLRAAMSQVALDMPRGPVKVDAAASHLLCQTLIGEARPDSMFDIRSQSGPITPVCAA